MSLRTRLVLGAAAAVAIAVIAVALFAYDATSNRLHNQIDATLRDRVRSLDEVRGRPIDEPGGVVLPRIPYGGPAAFAQFVVQDGRIFYPRDQAGTLPVSPRARSVAVGGRGEFFEEISVQGHDVRVLTVPWIEGVALQVARPLDEVNNVLHDLRWLFFGAAVVGVLIAGGLGWLAANTALRPVRRLTNATEEIRRTHDLRQRVEPSGGRELVTLATGFNELLGELDESVTAQRRLVADASHELRTPLTSLRTNVELLGREGELEPSDRTRLRHDIDAQIGELTTLIGGVIDLARGAEPPANVEPVQLDGVVADAVEQASFHYPKVNFVTNLEPSTIDGVRDRIERAVSNLLDNAGKWSPEGGEVDVVVRGTEVTVRDHGPGVDAADIPYVFDRFWRSAAGRSLPGSGLGLAIVRQVVDAHGGSVEVDCPSGGGARFRIRFPSSSNGAVT